VTLARLIDSTMGLATCKSQVATFDLQLSTCNSQLATCSLTLHCSALYSTLVYYIRKCYYVSELSANCYILPSNLDESRRKLLSIDGSLPRLFFVLDAMCSYNTNVTNNFLILFHFTLQIYTHTHTHIYNNIIIINYYYNIINYNNKCLSFYIA